MLKCPNSYQYRQSQIISPGLEIGDGIRRDLRFKNIPKLLKKFKHGIGNNFW